MAAKTQKELWGEARAVAQNVPPPPIPQLPDIFITRQKPEVQEALRQYNREWQDWLKKNYNIS